MTNDPLVSIVINNYNYADFLSKAINSALKQTYNNIEIIVVDDGSTDHSRSLIESYGEKIIPVLKENGGHASTFNAGFGVSKGEIIFFLDADDIFELNKVEKIVKVFTSHQDVGWCFNALKLFDSKTAETIAVTRAFPDKNEDTSGIYDFREAIKQGQLRFYPPSTSGLSFKRSLLAQILPMPEALQMAADRYLVNAAILLGIGYFAHTPLTNQCIHGNNEGTLQNDRIAQKKCGRNEMFTAYFLHKKFPQGWKFSHRTFARGWGTARRYCFISDEAKQIQQQYLISVSWWEKAIILMISWYQNRPWKKVNLYRSWPPSKKSFPLTEGTARNGSLSYERKL